MPLDEVALRKPEFTEGIRVTLGDGQEWAIPEYTYDFFPDYDENGRIFANGRTSYGPDLDADLNVWLGSVEVEPIERVNAMMRVAGGLLLKNYDLQLADLQVLLRKNNSDEKACDVWKGLCQAVMGIAPKA